jgi:hypothetical protein
MVRQTSQSLKGVEDMKRMLMAIMAVTIAATFNAPSFAGEEKKDKKDEKKGGHMDTYGEEKKDKKDDKGK